MQTTAPVRCSELGPLSVSVPPYGSPLVAGLLLCSLILSPLHSRIHSPLHSPTRSPLPSPTRSPIRMYGAKHLPSWMRGGVFIHVPHTGPLSPSKTSLEGESVHTPTAWESSSPHPYLP